MQTVPSACDLLIYGCAAVLPGFQLLENAAIAIDQGVILEIGAAESLRGRYQPRETIGAAGKLAMPGMYVMSSTSIFTLSPGMHISVPSVRSGRLGHELLAQDFGTVSYSHRLRQ